jgi:hypothetical protein
MATMCPNGRGRILGKLKFDCPHKCKLPPVVHPIGTADPGFRPRDGEKDAPHQQVSLDPTDQILPATDKDLGTNLKKMEKQDCSKHSVYAGKVSGLISKRAFPPSRRRMTGNSNKGYRTTRFPFAETRFIAVDKK